LIDFVGVAARKNYTAPSGSGAATHTSTSVNSSFIFPLWLFEVGLYLLLLHIKTHLLIYIHLYSYGKRSWGQLFSISIYTVQYSTS
jgi:hypothetical protein